MDNLFEFMVKERLGWKQEQWQTEKEKSNGMKRLINSMKFWNVKLSSARRCNNVIFTLFNDNEKAYPSLAKVAEELSIIDDSIEIKGYAKFRNKRYLSLTFLNEETRDFVVQNLRVIDNKKVAFLNWIDDTEKLLITVHWLSDATDLVLVADFLENYMDIMSMQKEMTALEGGKVCLSGKIIIKGNLKENTNIEDIPHWAVIDGLECLIMIEGRDIKCLLCQVVGHKASQCKKRFCTVCRMVKFRSHECEGFRETHNFESGLNENQALLQQNEVRDIAFQTIKQSNTRNNNNDNLDNLFYMNKLKFNATSENKELNLQSYESVCSSVGDVESQVKTMKVDTNQFPGTSSLNDWFRIDTNVNPHIREEASLGDGNFIIADTETEESDSSDTVSVSQWEQYQRSVMKLNKSVEVSRSLLKDTLEVIEPMSVDIPMEPFKTENKTIFGAVGKDLGVICEGSDKDGALVSQFLLKSLGNTGKDAMKSKKKKSRKKRKKTNRE